MLWSGKEYVLIWDLFHISWSRTQELWTQGKKKNTFSQKIKRQDGPKSYFGDILNINRAPVGEKLSNTGTF